jgi:pimeloyl-ACP methyl ester carboxylesterase
VGSSVPGLASTFSPSHRGGSGSPLLLIHGFIDTWRTWELVLPALERHHDVLAPTLGGHAGGPRIEGEPSGAALADHLERAMDAARFETAHIAGNSLGGYLALLLAARGRARSVVALAPAGGWAGGDPALAALLRFQTALVEQLKAAAPHADALLSSPQGRRRATRLVTTNYEHIPVDLLAHQMVAAAASDDAFRMLEHAYDEGWPLNAQQIACPVRMVWGSDDMLPWPSAAARYRELFPHADWVELDGIGHCPQLDVPIETAQLILGGTTG